MPDADEEIMRRNRTPRFKGDTTAFTETQSAQGLCVVSATRDNPFCGDSITFALALGREGSENPAGSVTFERVRAACWEGYGCSLCVASAEVLCEYLEAHPDLPLAFDALASDALPCSADITATLGNITVSRTRAQCVSLPLETLGEALSNRPHSCS